MSSPPTPFYRPAETADDIVATAARVERQADVTLWAIAAFGEEQATNPVQRGLRLLEEAIELFQSVGGDVAQAHKLVDYIFARPPGAPAQEVGGVSVCLLALCSALNISVDDEERRELARVLAKPIAEMKARNEAKNAAGFLAVPK